MADRSFIEQVEDDAAMFLLGASSAEQGARFEQRLAAGCAFCQAELRACESTLAALATSAAAAPPGELRRRLLGEVSQTKPAKSLMEIVRAEDGEFVQT